MACAIDRRPLRGPEVSFWGALLIGNRYAAGGFVMACAIDRRPLRGPEVS